MEIAQLVRDDVASILLSFRAKREIFFRLKASPDKNVTTTTSKTSLTVERLFFTVGRRGSIWEFID